MKDSTGNRLIIVYDVSNGGFMTNADLVFETDGMTSDYHRQMNSKNFEKWIRENYCLTSLLILLW